MLFPCFSGPHWRTALIAIFLTLSHYVTLAQESLMQISGTVIDAYTRKPLEGANVYLDRSTIGTKTIDSGKFVMRKIPAGNYTLVISYVGYDPAIVSVTEQHNPRMSVELYPSEKLLKEVTITEDPRWGEYLSLFKMFFLGKEGVQCIIKNPKALFFEYSDDYVLTAEANSPLIIENNALGYRMYYDLTDFVHFESRTSYSGHTRFEEMTPASSKEDKKWKASREKAYYGSFQHFMRSLTNDALKTEGFMVKKLEKASKSPANIPVLKKWQGNEHKSSDTLVSMRWNGIDYAPQDTTIIDSKKSPYRWGAHSGYNILYPQAVPRDDMIRPTASEGNYKLAFKHSLFITYRKKNTSILTMLKPETFVDISGNLSDPNAVISEGFWARYRVAHQLPVDYTPK